MTITLYDAKVSPNARKIRLIARELNIPLELVPMDFKRGDFSSPEFLAKNPNGMTPTLDDDGFVVWESGAILTYLAAKYPAGGLLPAEPKGRALVAQWIFWWTAHPERAIAQIAWEKRIKPFLGLGGNDPAIIKDGETALDRYLPVLDRQLEGRDYIGGHLSIVDFAAGPMLENAPRMIGVPLDAYANIRAWISRLQQKPYWNDA